MGAIAADKSSLSSNFQSNHFIRFMPELSTLLDLHLKIGGSLWLSLRLWEGDSAGLQLLFDEASLSEHGSDFVFSVNLWNVSCPSICLVSDLVETDMRIGDLVEGDLVGDDKVAGNMIVGELVKNDLTVDDTVTDDVILDELVEDELVVDDAITDDSIVDELVKDDSVGDDSVAGDLVVGDMLLNDATLLPQLFGTTVSPLTLPSSTSWATSMQAATFFRYSSCSSLCSSSSAPVTYWSHSSSLTLSHFFRFSSASAM